MQIRKILLFFALAILTILTACSPSAGGENQNSSSYTATMQVLPDPPLVGDVLLYFTVLDAKGDPITGATVEVGADHTDMSGMGMHGPATDQGKGIYAITTNFSMTGNWKIAVKVVNNSEEFTKDFNLVIQ